jgi:hypothetical protein
VTWSSFLSVQVEEGRKTTYVASPTRPKSSPRRRNPSTRPLAHEITRIPVITDLAGFIDRHARPTCEVLIVDPGRHNAGRFGRRMSERGFGQLPIAPQDTDGERSAEIRFLRLVRGAR